MENFFRAALWYVTDFIPGVIVGAFGNYLFFWIPLAIMFVVGIYLRKSWKKWRGIAEKPDNSSTGIWP